MARWERFELCFPGRRVVACLPGIQFEGVPEMKEQLFSIGQLARQNDINPKTIRYYERINLLPKPKRGTNNYRLYSQDTAKRLNFIMRAKGLGFTLKEIKQILNLSDRGHDPCEHIGELLKRRIDELEIKLGDLKKLKKRLKVLEAEWSRIQLLEGCNTDELICPKIERYFNNA